jgi:YHS domain-containing protein
MQTIHLKKLGIENSGYYCDPVTGECYSDLPMANQMATEVDPVCKMEVEVETAKYVSEYKGEKYYFCSAGCQKEFEENPTRFINETAHE